MRVVLDAYLWVRGTQSLKNVLHGLTLSWLDSFPEDEVTVVVPRKHQAAVEAELPQVRVVSTRLWPHGLSAMLAVPWIGVRRKADAVLTQNFSPLFGRARGVLIHDVMFETSPDWFTRKELLYFRWMTRSAACADVVFSTTETEGRRLRSYTRAKKVVTAGMGMTANLTTSAEGVAFNGLTCGSYMLAVGRLNVRKNLATTLEGARLSGLLTPDYPLVVVGERDGEWEDLPSWVRGAADNGRVVFAGHVSSDQLIWLIRNCGFFVCLSLDEGFGLPPVEARILGAQVLVSDLPVFRETLGDTATFVDPLDVAAVGARMAELAAAPAADPVTHTEDARDLVKRHDWVNVVATIRRELTGDAHSAGISVPPGGQ